MLQEGWSQLFDGHVETPDFSFVVWLKQGAWCHLVSVENYLEGGLRCARPSQPNLLQSLSEQGRFSGHALQGLAEGDAVPVERPPVNCKLLSDADLLIQ